MCRSGGIWQTRYIQDVVSLRSWGFKSLLRHSYLMPALQVTGAVGSIGTCLFVHRTQHRSSRLDHRMARSVPASVSHTQRNRIFLVILVALLLFFVFSYINLVLEHTALKQQAAASAARLHDTNERGLRLEQQLAYVKTDGYKETVARELGLARPGDKVLAIVPADTLQASLAADMSAEAVTDVYQLPIWQQWLDLFNVKVALP